jgi:hypothetical protein
VKPLLIVGLGFALRAAIIATNPIVWGGDTVIRLFDRHTLVKAHQLPLLQVLISGVSRVSMNPALVQYMMAAIGAIAGLGFYWVVTDLFGKRWAFPAALLFVTHPYILAVSTVPFQEILMLAGLLFAFHFFYTRRWLAASICLAIACLTRYEAWAACPVLAAAYIWREDRSVAGAIKASVLFGWMPAVWILGRHGLTSTGHFVVDSHISVWRFERYVYLGWIVAKFTQLPALLLAAVGAWRLYQQRELFDWRLGLQVAFLALFAIAVLFSAHGVMPDPERYVTSREAHIPMCFVLLLAACGLAQWPRWSPALVALSMVLGVAGAFWYVHVETTVPEVQLAYRLAQYLDRSLQPGERALLLAKAVSGEEVRLYLDKARETGGEAGLRQAQLELQEMETAPPSYQRVVVYSKLGRERLLASPAACAEWVAVWSDYPDAARELAGAEPVQTLRSGPLSVSVLRRHCGP